MITAATRAIIANTIITAIIPPTSEPSLLVEDIASGITAVVAKVVVVGLELETDPVIYIDCSIVVDSEDTAAMVVIVWPGCEK